MSGSPARRARPASSAGVYARRTERGPSWRVIRLRDDRARDEPDGGPREPPPPEVAHDEAQPRQLGEPAEQGDDGFLGQVVEDQRAERHVDRARPDGRLERVARDDVHLGRARRGPGGVSQDRRDGPRGPRSAPGGRGAAPTARAPAGCPPPRFRRRGCGGSRRPRSRARNGATWRRMVCVAPIRFSRAMSARLRRQLGGGRVEPVHQLAARDFAGRRGQHET